MSSARSTGKLCDPHKIGMHVACSIEVVVSVSCDYCGHRLIYVCGSIQMWTAASLRRVYAQAVIISLPTYLCMLVS